MAKKSTKKNLSEGHFSKVKRINIELPNYKYFHSPSLVNQNDNRFIGRKVLIEKFINILTQNQSTSGAYLVTGYRGMGKSSFVNKVLSHITLPKSKLKYTLFYFALFFITLIIAPLHVAFIVWLLSFIVNSIFSGRPFSRKIKHTVKTLIWIKQGYKGYINIIKKVLIGIRLYIENENYRAAIYDIKKWYKKQKDRRRRVIIKLNMGHEILNEKDILCLVAKTLEEEFKKYVYSFRRLWVYYLLKISFLIITTVFLVPLTERIIKIPPQHFPSVDNNLSKQAGEPDTWVSQKLSTGGQAIINSDGAPYESPESKGQDTQVINNQLKSNFWSRFYQAASFILQTTDRYLNYTYHSILTKIEKNMGHSLTFIPRYVNYYYILTFLLVYLVSSSFLYFIACLPFLQLQTRRRLLKKIKHLNTHIDASIKIEMNAGLSSQESKFGFNYNHKKSKEFPMAGIRQIEKNLIDIFESISQLVWPMVSPEFIIVFDELDKIDPNINSNLVEKEEESNDLKHSVSGISGGVAARLRKENVLKLLANLKYFITSAKAKFIFISGRELYDAYLADVSDREFSISSIFHDVIYIESFLSDTSDNNKADIVSMTEHYVCQFLMPEWYIKHHERMLGDRYVPLTLKQYHEYLKATNKQILGEDYDLKLNKTIQVLYQFIYYLTHVSNGAPKKITNLLERHIVTSDALSKRNYFFIESFNSKVFLSFGYLDQCKIGFIHYLAHPIILAVVNNVNLYGDKLLVSASFLIDHIFKFHSKGFSWSNLEHAPEILDINRTPELRNFIGTIIGYLYQVHLYPISSGLYKMKFPRKISEEISLISRLSEEASAIFNFSLDESLTVKRHYYKRLKQVTQQNTFEKNSVKAPGDQIHLVSEIHHILGDLHFLDEEYTDAIIEYSSCLKNIQIDFKASYNNTETGRLLFFIVRTVLKLGMVYEKRKTTNSAYIAYSELVSHAIDFRHIEGKMLAMDFSTEKVQDWKKFKGTLKYEKSLNDSREFKENINPINWDNSNTRYELATDDFSQTLVNVMTPLKNKLFSRLSLFEETRIMYLALLAKLFVLEKKPTGGISRINLEMTEAEFLYLYTATNYREKYIIASEFFKKIGDILFYKNGLIDSTSSTLFNALDVWGYNVNDDIQQHLINQRNKQKPLHNRKQNYTPPPSAVAGHLRELKISRIFDDYIPDKKKDLKNNLLHSLRTKRSQSKSRAKKVLTSYISFIESVDFNPPEELNHKIMQKVKECVIRKRAFHSIGNHPPCFACKYYNRSLKILASQIFNKTETASPSSKALLFLDVLFDDTKSNSHKINHGHMASVLSSMGDVMVSCSLGIPLKNNDCNFPKDKISKKFLRFYFSRVMQRGKTTHIGISKPINKIKTPDFLSHPEKALLYYLSSALYYMASAQHKEALIMYKKQLMLFIQYVRNNPDKSQAIFDCLDEIEKVLLPRIFMCVSIAYEHIHAVELQKIKWNNSMKIYDTLNLNQLSNFPEFEETIYAFYELKLLQLQNNPAIGECYQTSIKHILKMPSISPYRLNSTIYNRLISLRFKALLNREIFQRTMKNYSFDNDVYTIDHAFRFYQNLNNIFLNPNTSITELDLMGFRRFGHIQTENHLQTSLSLIEDIIVDSIFCLQKFLEIVYPHSKTTLFTNSYIGEIYQHLFEWSQIYDFLYMLYAYLEHSDSPKKCCFAMPMPEDDNKKKKKSQIAVRINNIYIQRYEAKHGKLGSDLKKAQSLLNIFFNFENHSSKNPTILCQAEQDVGPGQIDGIQKCIMDNIKACGTLVFFNQKDFIVKNPAKALMDKLETAVDRNNTHMIECNYLAELAIKKYRKGIEMHKEGAPYKQMIDDMYFLNDDLNNDSLKFFLALERYRTQSETNRISLERLKSVYKNSKLFEVENYI